MAGVVTTLKTDHALRVLRQPVDDLALAFVTPLGADDDDVLAHVVPMPGVNVGVACYCVRTSAAS